jgi:hypothetical protein
MSFQPINKVSREIRAHLREEKNSQKIKKQKTPNKRKGKTIPNNEINHHLAG